MTARGDANEPLAHPREQASFPLLTLQAESLTEGLLCGQSLSRGSYSQSALEIAPVQPPLAHEALTPQNLDHSLKSRPHQSSGVDAVLTSRALSFLQTHQRVH